MAEHRPHPEHHENPERIINAQNRRNFYRAEAFGSAEEQNKRRLLIEEVSSPQEGTQEWIQEFPFGNVVKPRGDTLLDHKRVLQSSGLEEGSLAFSAYNYPSFDSIIVRECGVNPKGLSLCPAFNPNDAEAYKGFAPLRRNIAILRNYLLIQYFPEDTYNENDPEDVKNLAKIEAMAETLGKALAGGDGKNSFITRCCNSILNLLTGKPLATPSSSEFMTLANEPDQGIQVMYDLLFSKNENKDSWNLYPTEASPFSDANLARYGHACLLETCAEHCENIARNFDSVDTLNTTQKAAAVKEGENILNNLRILLCNGMDAQEISEIGDPELSRAINLTNAVSSMQSDLAMLTRQDPSDINYQLQAEGKLLAAQAASEVRSMAGPAPSQEKNSKPAQQRSDDRNTARPIRATTTPQTQAAQGTRRLQEGHHDHTLRRRTVTKQTQAIQMTRTPQQAQTTKTAPAQSPSKPQVTAPSLNADAAKQSQEAAVAQAKLFAQSMDNTMSGDTTISAVATKNQQAAEAAQQVVQAAQQTNARREARRAQERARQQQQQREQADAAARNAAAKSTNR